MQDCGEVHFGDEPHWQVVPEAQLSPSGAQGVQLLPQ
jgi:hypothetical protein